MGYHIKREANCFIRGLKMWYPVITADPANRRGAKMRLFVGSTSAILSDKALKYMKTRSIQQAPLPKRHVGPAPFLSIPSAQMV